MKIQIIHGPNINLTGKRETDQYGSETLADINMQILAHAAKRGIECEIFQSNHEGEIIDRIHDTAESTEGIVLNAGAYTHYSYAIRDAIAAVPVPCIEVHFSNVHARGGFRDTSVIAPVCVGCIAGFGKHSYLLALDYFDMEREKYHRELTPDTGECSDR